MEQLINHYKKLTELSDFYITHGTNGSHIRDLMYIERILDRSRVEVSLLAVSDEDKERARLFVQETNAYLDTVIRQKTAEKIDKLTEEEKKDILSTLDLTHDTSRRLLEVSL